MNLIHRLILPCLLLTLSTYHALAYLYPNSTFSDITLSQVRDLDDAHNYYLEGIDQTDYYTTQDGYALRYTRFKAPLRELHQPPLSVLILHGRATFIEYYEPLIEQFLSMGIDVWTYDLEGQGGSTRLLNNHKKGHIDTFETYLKHLDEFIKIAIKPILKDKQLALAGYSLGGHIALRYLEEHPGETTGAFLISPMIGINVDIISAFAVHLFYYLGLHENFVIDADETVELLKSQFLGNPYTSNRLQYRRLRGIMGHYTDHAIGGVTFGWAKNALDSCEVLFSKMSSIEDPVYIISGSKDTAVDINASEAFAEDCPSCTHHMIEGAHHEIFRETPEIRTKLWMDLEKFIQEQMLKAFQRARP